MALSREGDRREGVLLRQGKGWFQVSAMGHEALAALMFALRPDDYLFPYYRDRALVLARGVTNYELALAYLAKRESSSGGRQMPGHFSDRERNIFSVATPTASQCIPAAGAAWSFKMAGTDQVVLTSVGDASVRQGEFYEAISFAMQEKLPIIFLIEDNRYGISTPTYNFFPYRIGSLGDSNLVRIDGRDPYEVFHAGQECIARARSGHGPSVLWCELDRLASHTSSDDHRVYRTQEDLAQDQQRDPLEMLARKLMADGLLTREEWESELSEIADAVDADYIRAESAPDPEPEKVTLHLIGPAVSAAAPPIEFSEAATMVAAVNQTLIRALDEDHRTIVFGEDIEDPKGGVFGVTRGLSKQFPGQVFNAPLAEATIVGAAVGLAAVGWRPIFEVQFIDFVSPALNQLMTQVASLRWRTCGDWACPMVLMAPYGAYLPGGSIWHSESNEGMWAHIHGLNVVIPSTPEDAAGLLWSAIHGNDPTLFLLPKHIFRKRSPVSAQFFAVPLGKAVVRRPGSDVTVVSWGNCLELAEEAAETVGAEGVSVEIIGLRCISPCDYESITESLRKTGRLVVLHEDGRTTGFGQCIITEMTSHPERFNLLLSAPQLVARQDVHVPFNPTLEYAVLPSLEQVTAAIRLTME
jgi:2-oxoisovalerate dehydrogenase E1 component